MTTLEVDLDLPRSKRLKAATHEMHERLDTSIMQCDPFGSRDRYGLFAIVQHQFHREIDALYADPVLHQILPDLAGRRRLLSIAQDLGDLGIAIPVAEAPPVFAAGAHADVPAALGWLFVAEGSNLGAASLLKRATQLGLSETFGARHLAAAPEGRGLHWRTFTAALDALNLSADDEDRVTAGARGAFAHVQDLTNNLLTQQARGMRQTPIWNYA